MEPTTAEALLIAALSGVFVVFDASYWLPLVGATPGPRFLIPILPFLGVASALAWRRLPLLSGTLASVSILAMLAVTITEPTAAADGGVANRLLSLDLAAPMTAPAGLLGWYVTAALFALALLPALAFTVAVTPLRRPTGREVAGAAGALLGWLAVIGAAHVLVDSDGYGSTAGDLSALAVATGITGVVVRLHLPTGGARLRSRGS